ncbi:MAG: L-threonine 3-dehydrogenase [Gammaproteobacteria bacterium]
MKSLAKLKREPGIWMYDAPMPEMGSNDVMIKIHKTSICGTDVHIYNWDDWAQRTIPVPMVVGHEYSGEIAAIGDAVQGFKIGDRVSGEGHISCGFCRNCKAGRRHLCRANIGVGVTRPGCFAEYLVIPAVNAYPLPVHVSDEIGSILDPLGNATHVALSFDLVGEDVLITGAGPIGIMAGVISRHVGARHIVITDVNDYRLDLVKKMNADLIPLNVQKDSIENAMKKLGMKEGFDVGFEMSGNAVAFNSLLEHMNHAGKIALLGFVPRETTIDWNQIIMKGLILKGIYGREMFETWYKMISMLQNGLNINPIVTHRFPIDQFEEGFKIMASGMSGKVVLDWTK